MNLAIFDIDGTVVNSVSVDDECFIQTFMDLYQIDLSGADWNDFEHVTDSGLTNEIFLKHLDRLPTEGEVNRTKDYFFDLLTSRVSEFQEISGASEFIARLGAQKKVLIAFATGGWSRTAYLKLQCLNIKVIDYILRSADDHYKRTEITKLAIQAAIEQYDIRHVDSITYFGDGQWDLRASKELNIDFVGIDYENNGRLSAKGAKNVIKNYLDVDEKLIIKKGGY